MRLGVMNPFINPKKRGVTLPSGCKDLVDILNRSGAKHDDIFRRFIHLLLFQVEQDRATQLVIGVTSTSGETPIRYKVEEAWYDLAPFPSHIRPGVISEIARMARFPAGQITANGQISGEGVLDVSVGQRRSRWIVLMTSADGECTLTHIQD